MTIASLSAVTITLTLVGIFLGVILNATKLAEDIRENVDVSVFVDIGTEQEDMDALEQSLNDLPNVSEVKFSSRDEELQKIQDAMGIHGTCSKATAIRCITCLSSVQQIQSIRQRSLSKLANCQMFSKPITAEILLTESLNCCCVDLGLSCCCLIDFVAMFLISIRFGSRFCLVKEKFRSCVWWGRKRLFVGHSSLKAAGSDS